LKHGDIAPSVVNWQAKTRRITQINFGLRCSPFFLD
jgi:hypothetical protein